MSKHYLMSHIPPSLNSQRYVFGKARGNQPVQAMQDNFEKSVLFYLSEKVINHLCDSLVLTKINWSGTNYNDFSFITAPAYKAFEGFLFQLAEDLDLPSSGNPKFVGTYFDEEKVSKAIDKLLKELENKAENEKKLNKQEKQHIKDMINEMKRFLYYYRHTPAHFHGEPINTVDRAMQNIMSMYRIINETVKTLLNAELIEIKEDIF